MTPMGYKEARTRQLLLLDVATFESRWIVDHKGRYELGSTITFEGRQYRVSCSVCILVEKRKDRGCL
jgi:hypothetical protein